MNPINKLILAIILAPKVIYQRLGVNVMHLKSILTTKLIMDDRRPNAFQQVQNKRTEKPTASATIGTILMSAVMGLFFLVSFSVGNDYVNHLTVYFSVYIVILASTLISDFTSVLIDIRDNYIILPKPVNDKTVVVARLLHILIHVSKLVVPMSLPAFVFILLNASAWGALVFIVLICLVTLFTLFLINALYIIILRLTTPEKFQNIISYFQIFIAIVVYGGYQIGARAMGSLITRGLDISAVKYIWLVPSYWFAGAWQGLSTLQMSNGWLLATALSFIVPLVSIWVVVKYFAPSFNRKLSQISGSNAEAAPLQKGNKTISTTSGYSQALAKLFTKESAEKMGFLFCWKMTSRSKDFKMKVYPSIGYVVVYSAIVFYGSTSLTLASIRNSPTQAKIALLSMIYFSSFILITTISQIAYSEKFKAAWIYFTTPIHAPGKLISGALKAAILKFFIPIMILITLPAIYFLGPGVIPNLVLGISNQFLICAIIAYTNARHLPFSTSQTMASKSGAFLRGLLTLIIPGVIGIIHLFLYNYITVVCIVSVLSIIANWLVIDAIEKTTWNAVKSTYE
jgi:ABC-2 type transport system permease protein